MDFDQSIVNNKSISRLWLLLAVSALALAGLFSLPPVILRGPFFADKLPVDLIFATSLVIHVDLSVLVWMLAIGGVIFSSLSISKNEQYEKIAFYASLAGMVLMAISPLTGAPNPLKNNYIPVLQNFTFILGLSVFGNGILLKSILTILNKNKKSPLEFGAYITAMILIISAVCFVFGVYKTGNPYVYKPVDYYEQIFWGGGHVLMFAFTNFVLIAWLWLADSCSLKLPFNDKATKILLSFNFLVVLPSPLFYLSDDFYSIFMLQMRHFAGITPAIIGIAILFSAAKNKLQNQPHAIKAAFILSVLLFGYGGVLGFMISGINVTIPAHYHGSIVGITLGFTALAYHLLPKLGYGEIKGKLASVQPYIYGLGQFCHITGLAIMGGYGALRKDAASSQHIDTILGKTMFFSGGALAILGGLLFIIVVSKSLIKKK